MNTGDVLTVIEVLCIGLTAGVLIGILDSEERVFFLFMLFTGLIVIMAEAERERRKIWRLDE